MPAQYDPRSDPADASWPSKGGRAGDQPDDHDRQPPPHVAISAQEQEKRLRRAWRRVVYGALWIIGALVFSLHYSTTGAGLIVIWWGAMLYGLITIAWNVRTIVSIRRSDSQ